VGFPLVLCAAFVFLGAHSCSPKEHGHAPFLYAENPNVMP